MVKLRTVAIVIVIVSLVVGSLIGVSLSAFPDVGTSFTDSTDITFETPFWKTKGHIEFLDENDHTYSTGWKPEGGNVKSEQIVFTSTVSVFSTGKALYSTGMEGIKDHDNVMEYWYKIYINGVEVKAFPQNYETNPYELNPGEIIIEDGEWYTLNLKTETYNIVGSVTGDIEVKLFGSFRLWHINLLFQKIIDLTVDGEMMGKDGAYLKSGVGYVRIGDSLPDLIEEGSDVTFYLQTGFTHGDGWTVYFVQSTGVKHEFREDGFNGQDGFGSLVDFTIPVGWFIPGGDNEVEIELYNHLWQESMSTFFVIDDIDLAPGKPIITWQTDYKAGSDVSVSVSSIPNNISNSPISYFRVYAYYGEPGSMPGSDFPSEFLIFKTDYSAQNNQADFSFMLIENQGGQVSMKINAIDQEGRASLGEFKSMNTVLPNEEGGGDDDDDVDYPFTLTLPGIIILIIAAIIISLLFLIKPIRDALIPFKTKYWYVWDSILVIAIIIIAYAVYWFGKNPGWTI